MTAKSIPIIAAAMMALPGSWLPAAAQALTEADVASMQINTVNRYEGMFRHARGEGPGRIEVSVTIIVGPSGDVSWRSTRNVAAETPKGTKHASLTRSGQTKIGVPGKVSDGSGDLLWVLDGNALVRMRTMAAGGHLHRITLTRTDKGWSCKSDAPFAREVGSSAGLKDRAAMEGGGQVEMLSIRQTGSSCAVVKS